MAFEKQDGVLRFTYEDAEAIRAEYQQNPAVRDTLAKAAGDEAMADAILNGPSEEHLEALRKAGPEDQELVSAFERVYGTVSAAALRKHNPSFGENIAEIPQAIVAGAQNAVAEGVEVIQNSGIDGRIRKIAADQLVAEAKERHQAELDAFHAITDPEEYKATLKAHAEAGTGPFAGKGFYPSDDALKARIAELETSGADLPSAYDYHRDDIFPEPVTAGEVTTGTGQVVEGVSQFATGFAATAVVPGGPAVKGVSYGSKALKYGRTLLRAGATDAFAFDPDDAQLVDLVEDAVGADLSGTVLDYIRKDDDDTDAEKRLKAALEGGALGVGVDGMLSGIRSLKGALKGSRSNEEVAAEITKFAEVVEKTQPRPAANGKPRVRLKVPPEAKPKPTQQAVETALGQPLPAPSAAEVARMRAVVEDRVKHARVRIEDSIDTDMEKVLQKNPTILEDIGITTPAGLREAAGPLMHQVDQLIDANDLDGLITTATAPGTRSEFRIRHAVFQTAAKASKATLDNFRRAYDDLTPANTDPRVFDEIGNRLNAALDQYLTLRAIDQNFGSAAGRELQQRQATKLVTPRKPSKGTPEGNTPGKPADVPHDAPKGVPAGIDEANIRKALENDYLKNWKADLLARGAHPRDVTRIIDDYVKEADREAIRPGAKPREVTLEKTRGQKITDTILTLRYNSMLSGVRTHETNIISGFANSAFHVASELGVAGVHATRGDRRYARAAASRLSGMKNAAGVSLKSAIKAAYDLKPVLGDVHFSDTDIAAIRNPLLTAPTRALLFTDEFFKGIWYRGDIAYRAAREAEALTFRDAAERKAFIESRIAGSVSEQGEALDLVALSHAQEITFQKTFNRKSKYQGERLMAGVTDWINKRDGAFGEAGYFAKNAFFPFARVSFRLTDAGVRLTPGLRTAVGLAHKLTGGESQWFDDFFGKNGYQQQAKAYGEFMMGWSLVAYTWAEAMDGNITGGAPLDYVDARGDRKTILPYHIKIGDKWYDYSRFEPFSTPLKLTANAVQGYRKAVAAGERREVETLGEQVEAVAGVAAFMSAGMFTSNSFAKGIHSLVELGASDNKPGAGERAFDTYATSYVPNLLKKINQAALGDDEVYRGNNPLEKIQRHFAWVSPDRFGLDRERDPFLGEPETVHSIASGWTNFDGVDMPVDPVHAMLKEARDATGARFTLKRPTQFANIRIRGKSYALPPGTDLRNIRADNGNQTIYDLYLENVSTLKLNGLTYREALQELADSERFRAAPWGSHKVRDNEKITHLRNIKTKYEGAALQVISQQPSLQDLARTQREDENFFSVRK